MPTVGVMSYFELCRDAPALALRYTPGIESGYEWASAALNAIFQGRDPRATPEEKEIILRFVEQLHFGRDLAQRTPRHVAAGADNIRARYEALVDHSRDYNVSSIWCDDCQRMVGWRTHLHCSDCGSPMATNTRRNCGHCDRCCTCMVTRCCNRRVPRNQANTCNNCGYCRSGCCHCARCEYEGCTTGAASCANCGGCYNHCQCASSPYGKPFHAKKKKNRTNFSCDRLVGVEWEFNRTYNHESRKYLQEWVRKWRGRIHHDGSCGEEVVTPPIAGDYMVACLLHLGESFSKARATADTRCSIHVHVDSRDIHWSNLKRLLTVYCKVEPMLYLLGGEGRSQSRYCRPVSLQYAPMLSLPDWKERVIVEAIGDRRGRHILRDASKKGGGRYRGLNLVPWLTGRAQKRADSTIEFRIHENTLDPKEVIYWTQLCARLVEWSATHSDEDVGTLPTDQLDMLRTIAPETDKWLTTKVSAWITQYQANPNGHYLRYENGVVTFRV